MFYVYIGDLKAIHKEIEKVSKENNMEIKYSKDITKEQFYGFFYKPSVYYFLYNKEQFTDNKYIDAFIAKSVKSDSIIICVVDDDIDKKFYRRAKDYVVEFPVEKVDTNYKNMILSDLANVYRIEDSKFVSALYSLMFSKYSYQAGFICNLILTGKLANIKIAKKLFILSIRGWFILWIRVGDTVYDVADKKTGTIIKADNLNCAYAVDFDGEVRIYGFHNIKNLKLAKDA